MPSRIKTLLPPLPLVLSLLGVAGSAPAATGPTTDDVAAELQSLATAHGFEVKGLANTEGETGRLRGEDLFQRLSNLLSGFDHVVVRKPDGGIERVIVLGKKAPLEERSFEILLDSKRQGNQHLVQVTLKGPGPAPVQTWVLLDTGADYVVLPGSMADSLGFPAEALESSQVQTANGKTEARMGRLESIQLGMAKEEGIEVAFIPDDKLGSSGLLGMSVLGRYTVTIDDNANQIRLEPKP
jgi:clan AA aspartic protease (TIGR02281 family)